MGVIIKNSVHIIKNKPGAKLNDSLSVNLKKNVLKGLSSVYSLRKLRGKDILIKPNLCGPGSVPHLYSSTDPALISSLVSIAKQFKAGSITVADHSAGYVHDPGAYHYALGMPALSERLGFNFIDLRTGGAFQNLNGFEISSLIENADIIINTTLPKTHHQVAPLSLCMKNLAMGLASEKQRLNLHHDPEIDIEQEIVNINEVIRQRATVIDVLDGRYGQDMNGPHFGRPVDPGFMVFGTDPVAVDCYASKLVGFAPDNISLLVKAREKGLGKIPLFINRTESLIAMTPSPAWKFYTDETSSIIHVVWKKDETTQNLFVYNLLTHSQTYNLVSRHEEPIS